MASAALDRLLHKATVLNMRGKSYRLRERRRAIGAEAMPAGADRPSEQPVTRGGPLARRRPRGRWRAPRLTRATFRPRSGTHPETTVGVGQISVLDTAQIALALDQPPQDHLK